MRRKAVRFEGGRSDRRLWHTYVFWARRQAMKCEGAITSGTEAISDNPQNRVPDRLSDALSTVLLSSFMLEYRLRRVLEAMGVQVRMRTTLGPLLDLFWNRLATVPRLDGKGHCAPPPEWKRCERTLRDLVGLRNGLAHADYQRTLGGFGKRRRPGTAALKYYNAVVDAVRLINQGTGSDPQRNANQRRSYFEPLKVRTAPRSKVGA
jgi:hypothetical protein